MEYQNASALSSTCMYSAKACTCMYFAKASLAVSAVAMMIFLGPGLRSDSIGWSEAISELGDSLGTYQLYPNFTLLSQLYPFTQTLPFYPTLYVGIASTLPFYPNFTLLPQLYPFTPTLPRINLIPGSQGYSLTNIGPCKQRFKKLSTGRKNRMNRRPIKYFIDSGNRHFEIINNALAELEEKEKERINQQRSKFDNAIYIVLIP